MWLEFSYGGGLIEMQTRVHPGTGNLFVHFTEDEGLKIRKFYNRVVVTEDREGRLEALDCITDLNGICRFDPNF
jgi:hypothetical protein